MMEELKPCPFCGSEADTIRDVYNRRLAKCPDVNCIAFNGWTDAEGWNTRPIEDALRAENARAKLAVLEEEK